MEIPSMEGDYQQQYQVYHKEGLLSQQSSVIPNAPLLYEQQVLLSKLRQGGSSTSSSNVDKRHNNNNNNNNNNAPSSPSALKAFPHHDSLDSTSQDTDDAKSEKKKRNAAPSRRSSKKQKSEEGDEQNKILSRYDSSLGLLTRKFVDLVKVAEGGTLDLNKAADVLSVQKRRIYDITNVLEGIGLIDKKSKNNIQWKGTGLSSPENPDETEAALSAEIDRLNRQELQLDENLRTVQADLKRLAEESANSRLAFVTYDDLRDLPSMQGQTMIAIKAPSGTRLEVPDPDEGMENGQRRYQIYLSNEGGPPIDVYVVSPYSDGPVSSEDWVAQPLPPSSPLPLLQDSLHLSPPHSMDPDYYLSNMLQGESISDLYGDDSLEISTEDDSLLHGGSWMWEEDGLQSIVIFLYTMSHQVLFRGWMCFTSSIRRTAITPLAVFIAAALVSVQWHFCRAHHHHHVFLLSLLYSS